MAKKKQPDVMVKMLIEVNLTELARHVAAVGAMEGLNLPDGDKLLATPGFIKRLKEYVREDLDGYASSWFAEGLEDGGLEAQGDLNDFLRKKFGLEDDEFEEGRGDGYGF